MIDTQDAVMTIDEVADYLKLPKSTVYKLAQKGELPGRKIGRRWRFSRAQLEQWLREQYPVLK